MLEPSKRSGSIQELPSKLEISLAGLATDLLAAEGKTLLIRVANTAEDSEANRLWLG